MDVLIYIPYSLTYMNKTPRLPLSRIAGLIAENRKLNQVEERFHWGTTMFLLSKIFWQHLYSTPCTSYV